MARLIVMGNEKGGSGKSTTAMHLITALVRAGHTVGALDLDLRQKSLFRYLDNRQDYMRRHDMVLPMPRRVVLEASTLDSRAEAEAEEESRFAAALAELARRRLYRRRLPRLLLDLLAPRPRRRRHADHPDERQPRRLRHARPPRPRPPAHIKGPSVYSEMVWKARQARAGSGRRPMDWVVLRNRMATLDARNKRRVATALDELARRIGFRLIPGFSERVVFRELFLSGLTLLDLREADPQAMSMSNIAARQEVRDLVRALDLPAVSAAA